jgi:hypothetical protein
MPIRTNRGRVAVYRRLWGWPIRSNKHLITTAVILIVLVVVIGVVLPKVLNTGSGGAAQPNASAPTGNQGQQPGTPVAPPSSQPTSTRLTAPLETPTPAPPDPVALNIAKAWATAWVNHPDGMTNEAWRGGLKPYTTDEYLPQLSTVEVTNIPATQVTGDPTVVSSFTSSVQVVIPTNGPKLSITVVRTDAGWRVSEYDQAS